MYFNSNIGFTITSIADNAIVIDYTLITSPPPSVVFQSPPEPSSKFIYIPWIYPTQVSGGSLNNYLPLINSLTCIVSGTDFTYTVLDKATTNCIKYTGQILNSSYITGLILTNINTNTGFQNITFPSETTPRYCYVYYNSSFTTLSNSSNNKVTVYYNNYNAGFIPSFCSYSSFKSVSPPSAPPTKPSVSINSATSSGNITGTIISAIPQFTVNNDATASQLYIIKNYKAILSNITNYLGIKKYSGYLSHTPEYTSGNTYISIQNLYPDSQYTVTTSAQNNSVNTLYSEQSLSTTFNTPSIQPTLSLQSITTPDITNVSARTVGLQSVTVNVYDNINYSKYMVFVISDPIHSVDTRGIGKDNSQNPILLSISINTSRAGTAIYTVDKQFTGFGNDTTNATVVSTPDISIEQVSISDAYTIDYLMGYYLNVTYKIKLLNTTNNLVDSPYQTVVNLTKKQTNTDGSILNTVSSSYPFYRDTFSGTTIVTDNIISINSGTSYTLVSGIYCATNNQVKLDIQNIVNNLGQYFYSNGYLLTYGSYLSSSSVSGVVNETSMPSGYYDAATNKINPSVTFQRTSGELIYRSAIYNSQCQIISTPYSWKNIAGTSKLSNIINVIFDPLSLSLQSSSNYPSTIPNTSSTTAITGYRVWSGISTNADGTITLPTTTNYYSISYNLEWDISQTNGTYDASQELLVYNGKYTSKGSGNGYINYSSISAPSGKSQPDYSNISTSGKRYATFVWKCTASEAAYYYLKLIINGCTVNISRFNEESGSIEFIQNNVSYEMKLFFRFQDTSSTDYNNSYSNTPWMNPVLKNNIVGDSITKIGEIVGVKNSSKTNVSTQNGSTYDVSIYSNHLKVTATTQNAVYLYVRVELPMSPDIGFSYISVILSPT